MDRHEQVRIGRLRRALVERDLAAVGRRAQHAVAVGDERVGDGGGQIEVVAVFDAAARAGRARMGRRMAGVDDDVAGGRRRRVGAGGAGRARHERRSQQRHAREQARNGARGRTKASNGSVCHCCRRDGHPARRIPVAPTACSSSRNVARL
jgi:hypothetical protein